ncbi:MAG: hypothetical protein ACRDNS_17200, partial [Trebonia sp.]
LLDGAVSARLGRSVRVMPAPSFTTQTGKALLDREFPRVTLQAYDVPLSIPVVQPVISYIASMRQPILRWIDGPLDFDAVLDDIAVQVGQAIEARGTFRATSHMGVFVCR